MNYLIPNMDFTLTEYKKILQAFQKHAYYFRPFKDFCNVEREKTICLRHDIDKLPANALEFAKIQFERGIKGTYFFRSVPASFNPSIIGKIAELGHEIGYHYEEIDLVLNKHLKKHKISAADFQKNKHFMDTMIDDALSLFEINLNKLRTISPVTTICMHGSPQSPIDNKLVWTHQYAHKPPNNYKDFGLIAEPYLDINFNDVYYLTDTGRSWDGQKYSVRDKIAQKELWESKGFKFKTSKNIISAIETDNFPNKAMLTFHPQRWTNGLFSWINEYATQNIKNQVKAIMIKMNKSSSLA